jgi:hypothetical protein
VKIAYKVADEETLDPLQQIHVLNDPDLLVFSCDFSHDQFFFESIENGHVDCKSLIHLLNLGDTKHV